MNVFKKVFYFYYNGFRSMTIGKTLWAIILIKLFIMFVVLRIFFFPNFLKTHFSSDEEKAGYVLDELTNPTFLSPTKNQ